MKVEVRARLVTRSMSIAAPVPMAVADPVAMTPMRMAVADEAAMAVMMPITVAAMHLNEQVAFGSGFRNGGLRCDGRRGDRSEQGSHSNDGCCQGHLRQHGFHSPRFGSSGVLDPRLFVHAVPELDCNGRFTRHSPRQVCCPAKSRGRLCAAHRYFFGSQRSLARVRGLPP